MPRPPSGEISILVHVVCICVQFFFLMFCLGYLVSKYFYTFPGDSRRSKSVQGRRSRTGEDKLNILDK